MRMRSANMGLVLRHLRIHGGRSRARLAAETGLSRATMSSVIPELVERGLVLEGEPRREGTVGRPGVVVELDGDHVGALGVEVNVDYLALRTVNLAGEVVANQLLSVTFPELGPEEVFDLVAREVSRALEDMTAAGMTPVAVAIAAPGVIDYETGTVRFAPNLGWRDLPLVEGIRGRLDLAVPVLLENDAKLAGLAEHAQYSSRGVEDLVCLTGGVGVGAGIVSGGHLVRGWKGFSGEVGHLPLDPEGRPCQCGRSGCWENIVGLRALFRLCAPDDAQIGDPHRPLQERLGVIAQRAAAGDATTLAGLEEITHSLGRGLSLINDVLNPQVVVLGGYFASFGEVIVPPLAADLEERHMQQGGRLHVETSSLGMAAPAHGAALLGLDRVFSDPTVAAKRGTG